MAKKIPITQPGSDDRTSEPDAGRPALAPSILIRKVRAVLPRLMPRRTYLKHLRSLRKPYMLTAFVALAATLLLVSGLGFFSSDEVVTPESLEPLEQASMHFDPLTSGTIDPAVSDFHFDTQRAVFGFNDLYNDVPLTVSQQPVPENVKSDRGELTKIARHIQAENSIESNKGTVYIASDENSASQTAVFANDEVLIFIYSGSTLTYEEWRGYINGLTAR